MTLKYITISLVILFLVSCSSEPTKDMAPEAQSPVVASPPSPSPPPPSPYVDTNTDESINYEEIEPSAGSESVVVYGSRIPSKEPKTNRFNDVVSQLSNASFAYSWPDKVNIKDRFFVDLAVNPNMTPEQVSKYVKEDNIASGTVRISNILIARLTAKDFEIEPITPERQAIDRSETTEWKWQLQPKSAGADREIKITIVAVVETDGEKVERFIKTYEGLITVEVTPKQRIETVAKDNWQWAWGALLLPFIAFIVGYLRKKKKLKDKTND